MAASSGFNSDDRDALTNPGKAGGGRHYFQARASGGGWLIERQIIPDYLAFKTREHLENGIIFGQNSADGSRGVDAEAVKLAEQQ